MFIIILLLKLLQMLKVFFTDSHQLSEFRYLLVCRFWLEKRINVFLVGDLGIKTIV